MCCSAEKSPRRRKMWTDRKKRLKTHDTGIRGEKGREEVQMRFKEEKARHRQHRTKRETMPRKEERRGEAHSAHRVSADGGSLRAIQLQFV